VRAAPDGVGFEALDDADAITFTSSSTVTGYLELAGPEHVPPVVACIGPITARTAMQAGLGVDVVATPHTVDALVEALVEWAEHRGAPGNRR
jgi:uroporphyrinogen-III synthase